jgi:hypothetical protein
VGFEAVKSAIGKPASRRSRCARARSLSSVFQPVLSENRMGILQYLEP